jgi:hypothetical protein
MCYNFTLLLGEEGAVPCAKSSVFAKPSATAAVQARRTSYPSLSSPVAPLPSASRRWRSGGMADTDEDIDEARRRGSQAPMMQDGQSLMTR